MMIGFLKNHLDPRGRSGRGDMLIAAILMMSVEMLALLLAVSTDSAAAMVPAALKMIVFLIGLSVTVRRLHDIGLSGWWVLGGAVFLCVWTALVSVAGLLFLGRDILIPGSNGHLLMVTMVLLPAVGIALWLHLTQGVPFKNIYGSPSAHEVFAKRSKSNAAVPQN